MKVVLFSVVLLVSACSPLGVAKMLLPGGGVNAAANTQAGKLNNQTIGSTEVNELKLIKPVARSIEQSTGDKKVAADRIDHVIVQEKDAPWLIIALAVVFGTAVLGWIHGWMTPSPREKKLKKHIHELEEELYGRSSRQALLF